MSAPEFSSQIAQWRQRLSQARGPFYWRSLEELASSDVFLEQARSRFPAFALAGLESLDRRRFMQLAAASMALMGLTGCGPEVKPRDREPYVQQPPHIIPGGRPNYYATATTLQGYGTGVLIEHRMGRPLKVEGNPDHPASLGATSAISQASILGLYDPYRAQAITRNGHIDTWEGLATEVLARRSRLLNRKGAGLALLTGTVTSPTLAAQIDQLRRDLPELSWYQWEAVSRDSVHSGALQAFGRSVDCVPDFSAADLVVAIESDFLDSAPGHLRFARQFASRRRAAEVHSRMSRLYALESTPTLAGAKADHRLQLSPAEIEAALRHLAAALGIGPGEWSRQLGGRQAKLLDALAQELRNSQGRALVHAGAAQSATVHTLVLAINQSVGAMNKTLTSIEPVDARGHDPGQQSLADLAEAIRHGDVDTLLILGASNPVFTAPADLEFETLLRRVPFSIYSGEYVDETAVAAQWHVPRTHEYETWSDVRGFDGTTTLQQPQAYLNPERRSAHELLALLTGETTPEGLNIVRERWASYAQERNISDFESFWAEALRKGIVPGTAAATVPVDLRSDWARTIGPGVEAVSSAGGAGEDVGHAAPDNSLVALFRPDTMLWDGRFADNGWLQELPRPLTRLTWDNAVFVSPSTAGRFAVATGDVVEISCQSRKLRAPVWVLPGQADGCITLTLGFGRRTSGPVATGVGFDAYPLRTLETLWSAPQATLRKVDGKHIFAPIQHEIGTHGRDIVHEGTLAQFVKDPDFLRHPRKEDSLYPPVHYQGIAWGMSINLNACIGCQACVAACQAENNTPVVGKSEVLRGREMHWLRVDRYYEGPLDEPGVIFQPVPCMHCENAPCEVVCPVHATVHDSEGLNVMVYNRCVGTRFCSNNCPYKVRRFNFFDYTARQPRPPESWNPDVSVRGRGVMEKCSYCIQRTREAMINADRENRRLRDGEVLTACQQVCPTEAIVFGDQNDHQSAVARRKASPLDYAMLEDLNTRPRTTYEALIRNPNPDVDDG
jgi:molybdopterin-containing oxidoreductase family iron-sulfur binding subunit